MPLKWRRMWVADETFESAGVFDVNGDGILDIVSGAFWYQGPDFRKKHQIGEVKAAGEYFDDFSTIALDINGDGRLDYVTGGYWGNNLRWRECPADPTKPWPEHIIAETGSVETTRAWDIDGDGIIEIVPNTPGTRDVKFFKLKTDTKGKGTGEFTKHVIYEFPEGQGKGQGHGQGCGDVAGNGRMDIVLNRGWLEAPKDPLKGTWLWHDDFPTPLPWKGSASCPILVVDVNGDGVNDLIIGNAHGYGLWWLEQKLAHGKRTWIPHAIDPFNAQYHDMMWVDIDGDGQCELVTGKRHRAHAGNEAGEWDDLGIYYFKWTGESFAKQIVNYGPIGQGKGCGIHFAVADLRGTGRLDIVAPG
ncbi:MAG: VCBS repeat-containing protein, partial [Kiritimatiellota bacterium]|nr:VCBS repeat-containing protein [Kiritimatiellota bacterium]